MLHSEKIMSGMLSRKPDEESQPVQSAPQPQQESAWKPEVPPYADPAAPIVRAHGVDESVAHDLWNDFHNSRTSADLVKALAKYSDLNAAVKHDLFLAKQKNDPAPGWESRLEKVVDAIKRVAKLHSIPARDGKSVAEFGEAHPNVMRALVDAELKS